MWRNLRGLPSQEKSVFPHGTRATTIQRDVIAPGDSLAGSVAARRRYAYREPVDSVLESWVVLLRVACVGTATGSGSGWRSVAPLLCLAKAAATRRAIRSRCIGPAVRLSAFATGDRGHAGDSGTPLGQFPQCRAGVDSGTSPAVGRPSFASHSGQADAARYRSAGSRSAVISTLPLVDVARNRVWRPWLNWHALSATG